MELTYNNEAGRLLVLLRTAKAAKSSLPTDQAWATVLRITIEPDSPGKETQRCRLMNALTEVNNALQSVEEDVTRLDLNPELLLRDFVSIRMALFPDNTKTKWGDTSNCLTEHALTNLEHCAAQLPKEDDIPEDDLTTLRKAVNELYEEVKHGNIRNPLKDWILQLLSTILKSLTTYEIRGARVFRESLSMILGELLLHKDDIQTIRKEHSPIWDRLWSCVCIVDKCAAAANKMKPLLDMATQLPQLFIGNDTTPRD